MRSDRSSFCGGIVGKGSSVDVSCGDEVVRH